MRSNSERCRLRRLPHARTLTSCSARPLLALGTCGLARGVDASTCHALLSQKTLHMVIAKPYVLLDCTVWTCSATTRVCPRLSQDGWQDGEWARRLKPFARSNITVQRAFARTVTGPGRCLPQRKTVASGWPRLPRTLCLLASQTDRASDRKISPPGSPPLARSSQVSQLGKSKTITHSSKTRDFGADRDSVIKIDKAQAIAAFSGRGGGKGNLREEGKGRMGELRRNCFHAVHDTMPMPAYPMLSHAQWQGHACLIGRYAEPAKTRARGLPLQEQPGCV